MLLDSFLGREYRAGQGMKMRWACFFFLVPVLLGSDNSTIAGRIVDAETGLPIACTVTIRTSGKELITENPSFRNGFRADGTFEKVVPPGATTITVSRGFDYVAQERTLTLQDGETRELTFRLRRRTPLRREGWYAGDNHDHMVHGEAVVAVDFPYAAVAARAEGLDYLALAQTWNLPRITPEDLNRECARVSTNDFLLTWNLEAPKNYFRGDASRCLGHCWTVAMRGRTEDGRDAIAELLSLSAHDYESEKTPTPNFQSHALIHSLGGVVSYSHPCRWWRGEWGGQGIYPVEQNKFISNMAVELPFDTIAGPTYDAIDVLMPGETAANQCAEQLWFMLLNKGYRIAATGSTDATFDRPGGGVPGRARIYTHLQGGFSLAAVAAAIKEGRSFFTTGPLLTLEMNGHESGDVIRFAQCGGAPCSTQIHAKIRAWPSGEMGSALSRIELIRNGEVARTFEAPEGNAEFQAAFDLVESERAWYAARCYGKSADKVAITNPVYFEPEGSHPPAPARASVEAAVKDAVTGRPLSGKWEIVRMVGKRAITQAGGAFQHGALHLEAPATAEIRVSVPGYTPLQKSIFLDYVPLRDATLRLRSKDLTNWGTFEQMKDLLKDVHLEFALTKEKPEQNTPLPN